MLTIFNVVSPVFGLVAFGYLAVRFKIYPATGIRGLITFVYNFATPMLLFRAMLAVDFRAAFNPAVIGSFYAGAIAVFIVGIVLSRRLFANTPGEAVPAALSATFSNCVLLGIPIIDRAYGDAGLPTIYSIVGLHAPFFLTLSTVVMELSRRAGAPLGTALASAGRRSLANPLLIGIALGLAGNLLGLHMVEPVDAFTGMMAQAVLPVALFGLGGALNEYRIRENSLQAAAMSGLKLMLHPAIAWFLMVPVLKVDHEIAKYAIVLSAMPTGINAYVFATQYNRSVDVAAGTVLIATASSVLSVSFWLYMMSL